MKFHFYRDKNGHIKKGSPGYWLGKKRPDMRIKLKGKKRSPEVIAKIKAARAKYIFTQAHRDAIGKAMKRIGMKPPSWKNKHHSKETIEKISKAHRGKLHYNWKGGRMKHGKGYILIQAPNHPYCTKKGYVSEHRLIMEKHLSRYLKPEEVIHHINHKKDDNRLSNLMLFKCQYYHIKYHNSKSKRP